MPDDTLIFVSRNPIPASFFDLKDSKRNLDDITQLLAKDQPDQPFWLGIYELPGWSAAPPAEDAA
jgi:hypothetical protein